MITETKRYEIDEVFNLVGEEYLLRNHDGEQSRSNIVVDGFDVHPISLRYMTFYQKGTKCVCCGKEGTHFKLCGDENTNRRHFNLFAEDGTLITKDHIVPKSKGGKNRVDNMQPMCEPCNKEKGAKYPGLEKEYIVGRTKEGHEIVFSTMEKVVCHIVSSRMNNKHTRGEWAKKAVQVTMEIFNALETGNICEGRIWTKEMR